MLKNINPDLIEVVDEKNLSKINKTLNTLLFIPDRRLKSRIIENLLLYINDKLDDPEYKMKIFIAYYNDEAQGFVMGLIHPTYRSKGKKCGTFGWLSVRDSQICKQLIKKCEQFVWDNSIRKIRGNVNFPKGLGGLGIQIEGFDRPMLYGVAFNDPSIPLVEFLEEIGYKKATEYICMEVTQREWGAGTKISKKVRLGYYTTKAFWEHKEDILKLGRNSFLGSMPMPDRSYRLDEVIRTYEAIPDSHFGVNTIENFSPEKYSDIVEFQEAWKDSDLNECIMGAPLAFDRETGELIGAILATPNLYQYWLGEPITEMNVDTVMVDKRYEGKGIFSALNNIGQLGTFLNGITYFEGTSIWNNNPNAKKAIFPHGIPVRKHIVMEKRLKFKDFDTSV